MNIVSATSSQREEIQNFIFEFWKEFFDTGEQKDMLKKRPDLLFCPRFYIERDGNFWILRDPQERIFATIGVHKIFFKEGGKKISVGFLRRFFVSKQYRSKGIGSALLEFVEKFCKSKNWKYLMFGVDESMEKVKKFYTKYGYEEFSNNIPQEILDDNDAWYFRKKLIPSPSK